MQLGKRIKFTPNRLSVPFGLLDKVMLKLETEQKLEALRWRFFLAAAMLSGFLLAFVFVLRLFWLDMASSGFNQYFSLIFSGNTVNCWMLPLLAIILFLIFSFHNPQSINSFIKYLFANTNSPANVRRL